MRLTGHPGTADGQNARAADLKISGYGGESKQTTTKKAKSRNLML